MPSSAASFNLWDGAYQGPVPFCAADASSFVCRGLTGVCEGFPVFRIARGRRSVLK